MTGCARMHRMNFRTSLGSSVKFQQVSTVFYLHKAYNLTEQQYVFVKLCKSDSHQFHERPYNQAGGTVFFK